MGPNLERGARCGAGWGRPAVTAAIAVVMFVSAGMCSVGAVGAQTSAGVDRFGRAGSYGAPAASRLASPVAGMASTPDGRGYWLVGADGGVFGFGDAGFYGSEGGAGVVTPFVGIAPTGDGRGYWIASDFGGVYNFGDAPDEGSIAGLLHAPVAGIASDPKATGYWLVAADGGVFSFGNAAFHGSMGNVRLNAPMVGIAGDARRSWLLVGRCRRWGVQLR